MLSYDSKKLIRFSNVLKTMDYDEKMMKYNNLMGNNIIDFRNNINNRISFVAKSVMAILVILFIISSEMVQASATHSILAT